MAWPPLGPELPRIHEDVLARAWQTDPYVSDPPSVTSTIASSLARLDAAGLAFLPGPAFVAWLSSSASAHLRKSPEEATLVYSLLALGAAVAGRGPPGDPAPEYAAVARYAADRAPRPSLPVVQARVVLALYYLISDARPDEAGDAGTAATLAAMALQLNMETDQAHDATAAAAAFPFGLDAHDYAECRRRTFWACFTLERLSGSFPFRPAVLHREDIFLRLPADDGEAFGRQTESTEPFFDASSTLPGRGMSSRGYLIQILGVWEDVVAGIYRAAHRRPTASGSETARRQGIARRLDEWKRSLPARFSREEDMGRKSPDGLGPGERASVVAMHLLYHHTAIKLHRHVRRPPAGAGAPADTEERAAAVRGHSRRILETWSWCISAGLGEPSRQHPFTSTALVEAVDVLSAEGALSGLPALLAEMRAARSGVAGLGSVWAEAQVHGLALDRRLEVLGRVVEKGPAADDPGEGVRVWRQGSHHGGVDGTEDGLCWRLVAPLEKRFPRDMDCIYSDTL